MRHQTKNYLVFLVILFSLTACTSPKNKLPSGLNLEEYELAHSPTLEPLTFQPTDGSQENILAKHEQQRKQVIPIPVYLVDGNPALKASWGGGELTAMVFTDAENIPEQVVIVVSKDETLLTTSAGMPSPVMPLQGLWTYGRHWALEILYADPETWAGRIFIDGTLINQERGYDEAFGFQFLSGKPFYFYKRNGLIGFAYDGREANLDYTNIPHYLCCSESAMNPIPAEDMVAFFAQRNETWYYVELGNFK